MNKLEFLEKLQNGLSGIPQNDKEERIAFYSEMIDDRMEEGLSEAEAVAAIGSIEDIISQTVTETPLIAIAKERIKPNRRLKAWEITLLILGAPLWLPLILAAVAVVLSLYITLWSVIISFWSVFVSFVASAFGAVVAGIFFALSSNIYQGIVIVAAGLICVGLGIFTFFLCKAMTKGTVILTKNIAIGIKNRFVKREVA